jgi:hypothetical protein
MHVCALVGESKIAITTAFKESLIPGFSGFFDLDSHAKQHLYLLVRWQCPNNVDVLGSDARQQRSMY